MFRKKNGQEFMDERNVDSSVNDKEEKKGYFHRRKKKEINLYEDDMGYIEEERIISEMAVGVYRAGADIYLTYFAPEIARLMDEGRIG